MTAASPRLTKRAQALLARIRSGAWYVPYAGKTPKAMDELLAAGLVEIGGRVAVMYLAYVPTGTKPFVREQYPETYDA